MTRTETDLKGSVERVAVAQATGETARLSSIGATGTTSRVGDTDHSPTASLARLCRAAAASIGAEAAFVVRRSSGAIVTVAGSGPAIASLDPDGPVAAWVEAALRDRRPVFVSDIGSATATAIRSGVAVPAPPHAPFPTDQDAAFVLLAVASEPLAFVRATVDILVDLAAAARAMIENDDRLRRSERTEQLLQLSLTLDPSRSWIADRDGSVLALSHRLSRLTGPAVGSAVEHILARVVEPGQRDATIAAWSEARQAGRVFDREVPCRTVEGGIGWYRLYATPHRNGDGEVVSWHGSSQNVTRFRRDRARLEHLAFRDGLTSLHNRAALTTEIERRVRQDPSAGGSFALFAIDIDDFKAVNDTLGYPAGNSVLRRVADCLRSSVRQTDIVARSGADEFFVLLDETAEAGVAIRCADRIIQAFRLPIRIDDHSVLVSPSIGITLRPRDGDAADDLLRNVDLALQRAKGEGGGTWRLFEPGMDDLLRAVQALKVELRDALPRKQFVLEFQPVVDGRDGRIDCFEALIRWHHPTRGAVSPLDFIPLAETTGLIVPIGRWVLQEACRTAAGWPENVRVAVNVSAIQIRHRDLMTAVEVALAASGLAPERLELEITESILLQDDAESLETIRQLRKRRIRIAVDDFGTGHATPRALNAFPFDKLKIDRAYVAGEATPWTLAIVRAAISMARALDLDVVAEGVERPEERDRLKAEGCHLFQGYLFGRPMTAGEAADLLADAGSTLPSDLLPDEIV